jgi:hypothetical protein
MNAPKPLHEIFEALLRLLERWSALGDAGVGVSIMCGPTPQGLMWSVQCCCVSRGEEFDRPFQARDFAHAIEIAELEARKRGWTQ